MDDEKQLFQQIPIPDSPFTAVKMDNKWFLAMGKYRLSEPTEHLEDVQKEASDASWFRIMQIINIMINEHEKHGNTTDTK